MVGTDKGNNGKQTEGRHFKFCQQWASWETTFNHAYIFLMGCAIPGPQEGMTGGLADSVLMLLHSDQSLWFSSSWSVLLRICMQGVPVPK